MMILSKDLIDAIETETGMTEAAFLDAVITTQNDQGLSEDEAVVETCQSLLPAWMLNLLGLPA